MSRDKDFAPVQDGLEYAELAVEIQSKLHGEHDPLVGDSLTACAHFAMVLGEFEDAEVHTSSLVQCVRSPNSRTLRPGVLSRGRFHLRQGRSATSHPAR